MAELLLEVITPAKPVLNCSIKSVSIPGTEGGFQVLDKHAPLLSTFEIGLVKVVMIDGVTKYYTTGGGTAEILNNKILVLADSFEDIDEIDQERAKRALERAKERLSNKDDKSIDLARAQLALKRAINRLDAVEKKIRSEVKI